MIGIALGPERGEVVSFKEIFAVNYLKWDKWERIGEHPTVPRAVLIAAPHTSNWDLPVMLSVAVLMDVHAFAWLGKHTLFEGMFKDFFNHLGGIPVDRRSRNNTVKSIAEEMLKRDQCYLAISPEGTRGYAEFWKSGFYHIAREANVPIIPGFLDYKTHRAGLGPMIDSQQPLKDVMDELRAFYGKMEGYKNELFGPIQLREEFESQASSEPEVADEAEDNSEEHPRFATAHA